MRELENLLERAFTLCEDGLIMPDDLGLPAGGGGAPVVAPEPERSDASEEPPSPPPAEPERSSDAAGRPAPPKEGDSLETYLEDIEKNVIVEALESTRWNKTAAAKKLGISFRALRYRLKKLDLE